MYICTFLCNGSSCCHVKFLVCVNILVIKSFLTSDLNLIIKMKTVFRYLHGNNVNGHAFVVFGVMEDEKKTSMPSSLQRVQVSFPAEHTSELMYK